MAKIPLFCAENHLRLSCWTQDADESFADGRILQVGEDTEAGQVAFRDEESKNGERLSVVGAQWTPTIRGRNGLTKDGPKEKDGQES